MKAKALAIALLLAQSCNRAEEATTDTTQSAGGSTVESQNEILESFGYFDPEGYSWNHRRPLREQIYRVIGDHTFGVQDRSEAAHSGGPIWVSANHTFPIRATVDFVRPGPLDKYVASTKITNGGSSIELWSLEQANGSITVTPNLPGIQHDLVPKRLLRAPLHDPGNSEAFDILLDREGRYALTLTGTEQTRELRQYTLNGSTVLGSFTLASESSHPDMPMLDYMNQFKHSSLGTVVLLQNSTLSKKGLINGEYVLSDYAMLFVDSDNDGTFDAAPFEGTPEYLEASGVMIYDDFTQAFELEYL